MMQVEGNLWCACTTKKVTEGGGFIEHKIILPEWKEILDPAFRWKIRYVSLWNPNKQHKLLMNMRIIMVLTYHNLRGCSMMWRWGWTNKKSYYSNNNVRDKYFALETIQGAQPSTKSVWYDSREILLWCMHPGECRKFLILQANVRCYNYNWS